MNKNFNNNNSIIGSQGDNNIVHQHDVNQVIKQLPDDTDFEALAKALAELKSNALTIAKTGEDYKAVAAIADATEAADKKDGIGLLSALKAGGKFVADVATKFSASMIVELMKNHHLLIH